MLSSTCIGIGLILEKVIEVVAISAVYLACAVMTVVTVSEVTEAITDISHSRIREREIAKAQTATVAQEHTQSNNKSNKKKSTIHIHHIVAKLAWRAAPARKILQDNQIGIYDNNNLVPLPAKMHASMHTTAYYAMVNSRLLVASFRGRKAVLKELRRIKGLLESAAILYMVE